MWWVLGRSYERRSGTRRGSARPSRRVAKDGHVLTPLVGTLSSSNALTDSKRRRLFLKRRYDLDIRSNLDGMHIPWAVYLSVIRQYVTGR